MTKMPAFGTLEAEQLFEPLREAAGYHLSTEDFVEDILGVRNNMWEGMDKSIELIRILYALRSLCGSPKEGAKWIFRSRGFERVAGNDAYLHLKEGNFWTIANMADFLEVLAGFKDSPDDLYKSVFNYTPERRHAGA